MIIITDILLRPIFGFQKTHRFERVYRKMLRLEFNKTKNRHEDTIPSTKNLNKPIGHIIIKII